MPANKFKKSIDKLKGAIKTIKTRNIDLSKKTGDKIYDFKGKKDDYYINLYKNSFNELKKNSFLLNDLVKFDSSNEENILKINVLLKEFENFYKNNELDKISPILDEINALITKLKVPAEAEKMDFRIKNIPEEIISDIKMDLDELEKCFSSECYRSAVILCGRLLETALHRKYYELTGSDMLEKNPGIGLGKIIAKLDEKNFNFGPGLTQQIHLINQVRISSVHQKNDAFYPTKKQAHAIILYTIDTLEKIFSY